MSVHCVVLGDAPTVVVALSSERGEGRLVLSDAVLTEDVTVLTNRLYAAGLSDEPVGGVALGSEVCEV